MSWKTVKPIQKGDLVKLKVPPFNIGLVIDVGPGAHLGASQGDQLLAVMWQGYDKLMEASRIPFEAARSIQAYLNQYDYYFDERDRQLQNEVWGFVVRNAGTVVHGDTPMPSFSVYGEQRTTSSPIAIINTHRLGMSLVRVLSRAEEQ